MDPLTSIAAASKTSSFWVTKELTSVLAPGVVVLAEIMLLVRPLIKRGLQSPLGSGEPNIFALLTVVLALAWLVGYIGREIAFKVLGLTEPRKVKPIEGDPTPFRRWYRGLRYPHKTALEIERDLRAFCGDPEVEAFRRAHPIADHLLSARDPEVPDLAALNETRGGNMINNSSTQLFTYCKLWLRRHAPEFGLETIELEINIVAATLVPVALLPVVTLGAVRSHAGAWATAAAVAAILIAGQIARSYHRLRGAERWEAVRNTMIATMLRRADAAAMMADRDNYQPGGPPAATV